MLVICLQYRIGGQHTQEDTRERNVWVRDDALASLGVLDDTGLGLAVLFSDQGRDIGLESSGTETEGDNTKDERTDGIAAGKDSGNGGDDEQDVTQDGEGDGDEDGVEATKVLVGDNGTDDGCAVCPERVELTDTEGCTLSHAQRAWLTL